MKGTWTRDLLRMGPILVAGLLGIAIAAPSAAGQAAIDQYVPKGDPAGGSGGAGTLDSPISTPGSSGTSSHKAEADQGKSSGKGGRLPVTDYPGTPFLWILLALLVAGALIRFGTSWMKRRGIWSTT
jgi:hypothetical protein